MSHSGNVLVAGLGSAHGDDQAGWFVAESLATLCRESRAAVVRQAATPLDLLNWLDDVEVLHICDACESTVGREKLHRFRWTAGRLVDPRVTRDAELGLLTASLRGCGTHNFGLPDVLRLAETMRRLPQQVTIWGIEGLHFQPGDVMTEETRCTALRAVRAIMAEFGGGSIAPCL